MQAGRDENDDVLSGNARFEQPPQQRRQSLGVGRGPGNIANGDGGAVLAGRQRGEGRRADGRIERRLQSLLPVRQRLGRAGLQHAIPESAGQLHLDSSSSKREIGLHDACSTILHEENGAIHRPPPRCTILRSQPVPARLSTMRSSRSHSSKGNPHDSAAHLRNGVDAHDSDHDLLGFLGQCAQDRQRLAL